MHSPIDGSAIARALLPPRLTGRIDQERLERLLLDRFMADAVVLCQSGTHALQIALDLAREETGRDEVALPAFTCYDLATAGIGASVRPTFYDLDPDTLLPEPESLRESLARRPAAVVAVHHFGLPTPLEPLRREAAVAGAWLIEDAAQAHGGCIDGQRLGSLAPLSILSFGRGKGWTGGGGGALLLRGHAAGAAARLRARLLPAPATAGTVGKLALQWLLARPSLYAAPAAIPWLGLGETRYSVPSPPAKMSPAMARLTVANDAAAEAEVPVRRDHARRLRRGLEDAGFRLPPEYGEPGYLRLPIRVPGRSAVRVLSPGTARLGVLPSYPRSLPSLDAMRDHRADSGPTPGAETLARELFTAPTHSLLRARELDRIEAVLRSSV